MSANIKTRYYHKPFDWLLHGGNAVASSVLVAIAVVVGWLPGIIAASVFCGVAWHNSLLAFFVTRDLRRMNDHDESDPSAVTP